jgi:hypothetical protein
LKYFPKPSGAEGAIRLSVSPNPTLKMTLIIMIVELVKKLMGEEDMAVLDYVTLKN